MSNILCHLCGGLVDRIGLQPTGVRLCGCVAKFKARKARIAELTEENARLKAGYFAVGEVREHNGSLMVVGSLHPSIELDALPIGTKVYISVGDRE